MIHRWPIGTQKDAQHHQLLEKCKLKQWNITSDKSGWLSSKRQRITRECRERGNFVQCWWECKSVQPQWLDGITDSNDTSLSKLRKTAKDREVWRAAVHGVTKSQRRLDDWVTTTFTAAKIWKQPSVHPQLSGWRCGVCVCTWCNTTWPLNGMQFCHLMNPGRMMLSEICQRKTSTLFYHVYMESKK